MFAQALLSLLVHWSLADLALVFNLSFTSERCCSYFKQTKFVFGNFGFGWTYVEEALSSLHLSYSLALVTI